jgi:hypothetical protein
MQASPDVSSRSASDADPAALAPQPVAALNVRRQESAMAARAAAAYVREGYSGAYPVRALPYNNVPRSIRLAIVK